VYGAFSSIIARLIAQRPDVVEACEQVLAELMDTADLEQRKQRLVAEQTRITERVEALMARASREVVDDFPEQYAVLEAEMNRVTEKLEAVEREKGEREYRERQCRLFLRTIQSITPGEDEVGLVESDLFLSLVDKVIVGEQLRFILRDGTEWTV
jgi:hypothetical protein